MNPGGYFLPYKDALLASGLDDERFQAEARAHIARESLRAAGRVGQYGDRYRIKPTDALIYCFRNADGAGAFIRESVLRAGTDTDEGVQEIVNRCPEDGLKIWPPSEAEPAPPEELAVTESPPEEPMVTEPAPGFIDASKLWQPPPNPVSELPPGTQLEEVKAFIHDQAGNQKQRAKLVNEKFGIKTEVARDLVTDTIGKLTPGPK